MCGRYSLSKKPEQAVVEDGEFLPRYNIAPTQSAFVMANAENPSSMRAMQWGFQVPGIPQPLFNARAETLLEKKIFRSAVERNRCLVPADGFYEWKKEGKSRHPMRIQPRDKSWVMFAGFWMEQENGGKRFTIITTEANNLMKPLHHRMPVILDAETQGAWINPGSSMQTLKSLLVPCAENLLEIYPLDSYVNNVRYDGPACFNKPAAVQQELF